ncbi:MAG: CCA tRNA nucleotidyltransferase [Thermoguttaceae bacterium]
MMVPEEQRRFATQIVRQLREAGFEAYWAGGCVRDQLLGRTPKDYDIASSATPEQIRELFGRRRTLAIGAAFGVITVLGPKPAGMVEVTTFRQDAQYSDGRHPDSVTFSSAEEDAARRDFTINGLFYDPIEQRVIDYVGGREDLDRRVIRAIGRPEQRFAEDKLRMLRAVRFAATFDFQLEADTAAVVRRMADQITVVSPERIAMEIRRMLVEPCRAEAVRLLVETGLAGILLPEIVPADDRRRESYRRALAVLGRLREPGFPLALATLLGEFVNMDDAHEVCLRWKLSNKETDRVDWLIEYRVAIGDAQSMPWSRLQPILIAPGIEDLLALNEAAAEAGIDAGVGADEVAYCRELLEQPDDQLDPPPLLTGDDLIAHGIPSGPKYRILLEHVRADQLDGSIETKAEALALVDRLLKE